MLELMGYETGMDLHRVLAASARLPGLIGHDTPSQILRAGRRLDLHPIPEHVHTLTKQMTNIELERAQ